MDMRSEVFQIVGLLCDPIHVTILRIAKEEDKPRTFEDVRERMQELIDGTRALGKVLRTDGNCFKLLGNAGLIVGGRDRALTLTPLGEVALEGFDILEKKLEEVLPPLSASS